MTNNFTLPKDFWAKLEEVSLEIENIINGRLYICRHNKGCILEFKNIVKSKYCVERMEIDIREYHVQLKFDVILNFSDLIVEDDNVPHFCFLTNRGDITYDSIYSKAVYNVNMLKRFNWTLKILEHIRDLFDYQMILTSALINNNESSDL